MSPVRYRKLATEGRRIDVESPNQQTIEEVEQSATITTALNNNIHHRRKSFTGIMEVRPLIHILNAL